MKSESGIDMGECPGCHGDLEIEEDAQWGSGYALVCPNEHCGEHGVFWAAPGRLVARMREAGELPVVCEVVQEIPRRVREAVVAAFFMGGHGL